MALADTARLIVQLVLDDKMSGPLGRVDSRVRGLQGNFGRISKGVGQVSSGLNTLGTRAAIVAGTGLAGVVKTAIDFESAFAGVRKTVEATPEQLEELNAGFRELARTIPLSFEEFAAIGEQAGALGIARDDILEFTEVVAKIGTTTNVSSEDAATALGQLSNVLRLTGDDFDNFGAALVNLGNKGASTEAQILEITSRAGAGAKLVGIAADETLGWASAVANLGVEVEAGGSALQQFFLQSTKNLEVDERLKLMGKTAGVTAAAFKKAFEKDASGALQSFLGELGKLDRGQQLKILDDLGFKGIRLQRVLLGLANNQKNLRKSLDDANEGWRENRALNEEAQKRYDTTASKLQILKNNVRDAANTIGSQLLPVIADLSEELVDFINKPDTQRKIKEFADNLAKGARDLVAAFKRGDFDQTIETLKGAAAVAKTAFDAFNALPQPVKQLALAAIVANKVTGGAVGQIAGGLANIFKGLGGIFARGSTPANPLFVSQVGPGGGIGGGLGGLGRGGLGGNLLKLGIGIGGGIVVHDLVKELLRGENAFTPSGPKTVRPGVVERLGALKGTVPVKVTNATDLVDPALFSRLGEKITRKEDAVQRALERGDLHHARLLERNIEGLHQARGSIREGFTDVIPKLGEVNRALSTANRNLDEGNRRQRETAQRVAEARERIGTGFQQANSQLGEIKRKPTQFTANVTNNITATLSTYQSLQTMTRLNTIRTGFAPGDSTGGSI